MLAADFIWQQPDLSDRVSDESLMPAVINPANRDSAEFDSAGNLAGIWFQVLPMIEPDQEYFQKGTTLWLRLSVDSAANPLKSSDEIRVFIKYDSDVLFQSGDIVLAENISCELDGEFDFANECRGSSQPASRDLLLEVPMLLIGEGNADITVTVLRSVSEGDFDTTEVVFTETTRIVAGSSGPDDLGPKVPDGVTPTSGGLVAFPLPSADSERLRPSLVSRTRSLDSEDASDNQSAARRLLSSARTEKTVASDTETLTVIGKRDRRSRASWEWYLADDATTNLFRPLAMIGDGLKDAPAIEDFGPDLKFLVAHSSVRQESSDSTHESNADARRISEATDAVMREIFAGVDVSQSEGFSNPSSNPIVILQTQDLDSVLANWKPRQLTGNVHNLVDKESNPRRPVVQ